MLTTTNKHPTVKTTLPPGPRSLPIIGNLLAFLRDPPDYFQYLQWTYGDLAERRPTILLSQTIDCERGKSARSFFACFYRDDVNERETKSPSFDYTARILDARFPLYTDIGFDEITRLLQIDPEQEIWKLTVEPDPMID